MIACTWMSRSLIVRQIRKALRDEKRIKRNIGRLKITPFIRYRLRWNNNRAMYLKFIGHIK
jgi:hypothetical protein